MLNIGIDGSWSVLLWAVIVISYAYVVLLNVDLVILYFLLVTFLALLYSRTARFSTISIIFTNILRRTKHWLLHAKRIIQSVVLVGLVRILAGYLVEYFRVEKYLVGSLGKQDVLLIICMLKKQTTTLTYELLLLNSLLHLYQPLFSSSVIYNHRAASVSVVHTKLICEILRPSLAKHLIVVSCWWLIPFSLNLS